MHRSGTSVAGRLLNLMGCYFAEEDSDVIMPAKEENPKGFWERNDVLKVNDELIESEGALWDCPLRFDASRLEEGAGIEHFVEEAKRIVNELNDHEPWFAKDPRFCLTLPAWRKVLERPLVVHVFRNPLEVALSFRKRNGASLSAGLALWEYHVLKAVESCKGLPCFYIRHEDMVRSPEATARLIYERLTEMGVGGLVKPDDREVAKFVDASLYRNRATGIEAKGRLSEGQCATWEYLVEASEGRPAALPRVSEDALSELEIYEKARRAAESSVESGALLRALRKQVECREKEFEEERRKWREEDDRKRGVLKDALKDALKGAKKSRLDLEEIDGEMRRLEGAGRYSKTRIRAALRLLRTGKIKGIQRALERFRKRMARAEGEEGKNG
jgi:hypothetical protein